MSTKALNLGLIVAAGILSACHPTEPTHSVEWFKEHRDALEETVAKCNSNPGELMLTPNCVNASRAQGDITWGGKGTGGVHVELPSKHKEKTP